MRRTEIELCYKMVTYGSENTSVGFADRRVRNYIMGVCDDTSMSDC